MGSSLQKIIYALHGFLGEAKDWSKSFSVLDSKVKIAAPNYYSDPDWDLSSFDQIVEKIKGDIHALQPLGLKVFIGYSLGGRIGLHLLERYPELFDRYIFISTHPGLKFDEEKSQRLQSDQAWSEKLIKHSWNDFLNKWNHQPVFKGSADCERAEHNFLKPRLVNSLEKLSLASHKNFSEVLKDHQHKVHWVVGDLDQKFNSLAEELLQKKILLNVKRIFSGHRILFDNPNELAKLIDSVIES